MDPDRLRILVAEHVRRALNAPAGPVAASPPGAPTVGAVFCGGHAGLDTALAQLRLVAARAQVVALLSRAAKEVVGEDRLRRDGGAHEVLVPDNVAAARDLAHRASVLVVAQLTHNTLAKVALGISDAPAPNLILHALLGGKPVVVVRDGVDPRLAGCDLCAGGAETARELLALYDDYLGRLAAYGCRVVPARLLSEITLEALAGAEPRRVREARGRRVVTEDDIVRASRRGESVDVTGAIVTALARDTAHQLGVPLIER